MPDCGGPLLTRSLRGAAYFGLNLVRGLVPSMSGVRVFGRNNDIDIASGYEAIWHGGGSYTGFDATAAETVETYSSDAADTGTVQSSGTLTSGTATTAVDTGADFVSDGVAAGDIVINDTQNDHMIVDSVATTTLTGKFWKYGTTPAASDAYRVVTTGSTGAAVVRWARMLDANGVYQTEYIVLNGVTGVDSTGTYLRSFLGEVVLAGSGNTNAGTITSRQKTTTANVFTVMPASTSVTMVCAYTVPAGKTGYLHGWGANLTGKVAAESNARVKIIPYGEAAQLIEDGSVRSDGSSSLFRHNPVPSGPLPQWTDIVVEADTNANNTGLAAHFGLILVDD